MFEAETPDDSPFQQGSDNNKRNEKGGLPQDRRQASS
jgi:hypothetical protein